MAEGSKLNPFSKGFDRKVLAKFLSVEYQPPPIVAKPPDPEPEPPKAERKAKPTQPALFDDLQAWLEG